MFTLEPDVVHVWTADLDRSVTPADVLDADELARAQRFYFEHDRRHFAATRAILRVLLGKYVGARASEIRFGYGNRGKPFLRTPSTGVRFNLSHSHGRAMFALALDRDVGIDLEAGTRLKDDWPGVARRVFSAREQAELAAISVGNRRAAFLDGWTRKEAYLKATGLGIVDGLQSIEVTLGPERSCALLAAPAGLGWSLHDLRTDQTFAAALVVEGDRPVQLIRRVLAVEAPPFG